MGGMVVLTIQGLLGAFPYFLSIDKSSVGTKIFDEGISFFTKDPAMLSTDELIIRKGHIAFSTPIERRKVDRMIDRY